MTIQNAPPGLDYDRDRKFSKVWCSFWLDGYVVIDCIDGFIWFTGHGLL